MMISSQSVKLWLRMLSMESMIRGALLYVGMMMLTKGGLVTMHRFLIKSRFHFKGIILNAPLVQRRLHEAGHHPGNWENSYRYEAAMIMSHRQHLPEQVWRKALFSVYMNYGDKLRISKLRQKALGAYLSAFRIKPAFSAVKKIISLIFS